ncbi:MAG: hypothetical protein HYZ11_12910 [Candidatus Tectomicrobia bacterium]|uniref:Uncharacterized protein n=1 Tax=Tectimicrobiota bacterium TaxID=2528274 RepID=A0A932MMP1_UNCTE|nr:hypothetical protein [Candidatus Tectomicrobia bacterium]
MKYILGDEWVKWLQTEAPFYVTHEIARWGFLIIGLMVLYAVTYWEIIALPCARFLRNRYVKVISFLGKEKVFVVRKRGMPTDLPGKPQRTFLRLNTKNFEILDDANISGVVDGGSNVIGVTFISAIDDPAQAMVTVRADRAVDYETISKSTGSATVRIKDPLPEIIEIEIH